MPCKKIDDSTSPSDSRLSLEEAKIFAKDLSNRYWQNKMPMQKTATAEMLNWPAVKNYLNNNGTNTFCVPVKETVFSIAGYRKLMLAKRNNQLVSVMLVVKPTVVYLQTHGNKVNAKDFNGDLHFYSAETGKYLKGAECRMVYGGQI